MGHGYRLGRVSENKLGRQRRGPVHTALRYGAQLRDSGEARLKSFHHECTLVILRKLKMLPAEGA